MTNDPNQTGVPGEPLLAEQPQSGLNAPAVKTAGPLPDERRSAVTSTAEVKPRTALRRRTRIKICGVSSVEMALAAADAGADAIGLVFAASSPRYVLPGPAQRIARALPPLISSIGVFLNPSDPDLQNWRGQWVQMHGQEEEWQLARIAPNRRIIKGMKFDAVQVRRWEKCPHVSALLIDGAEPGSGIGFSHERLAEMLPSLATPVILAGGLTPETVGEAIRIVRPFGVDVSSGVEISRGVKDTGLIREFCAAVREADESL